MIDGSHFVQVGGTRIEYAWVGEARQGSNHATRASTPTDDTRMNIPPLMVFLHEGLGSLALWKDFPTRLCGALGMQGLVYSRRGYGRSTPRAADEHWATDFMHRQAIDVLPAFLKAVGVDTARNRPWLFGHSDGASIALIHAAHHAQQVAGVVAMAPHVFVEDISIRSIRAAHQAYLEGGLRERLSRWHDEPDSAFFGWSQAWLDEAFLGWSLVSEIVAIDCPLLLIQGHQDEYGTMAQLDAIARAVPHAMRLALDACGHSPHRDHPEAVIAAVIDWVERSTTRSVTHRLT